MATTVAEELLIGCFTSVLGHPDFTVSSERMAKIKTLAEKLLAEIKTEKGSRALKTFASKVSAELLKVVSDKACSKFSSIKVKMLRQFHDIRTTKLKDLYSQFLAELSITETDPLLIQYAFDKMFEETMKWKFSTSTETKQVPELTSNDHNALRYSAGFVPYALKKKILKGSHPMKESFLSCLSSMGSKGQCPDDSVEENFLSFTKKWIARVNRGGLFFVSDEVYTFFLELEEQTRKFLPELIKQGRVNKSAVLTEITADDSVQFHWCIISANIDDEAASQELLCMVAELWLTIRGFSIAGSYVEYFKQCNKASNKKKSLRKGLKRKHEEKKDTKGDEHFEQSDKQSETEDKQSETEDKQSDDEESDIDNI